jgi:type IV secretion system protein VirB10
MQGTAIPALMLGGINSDIPSKTIVAQVQQDIYDTATGAWLLIPSGTKAIGEYDNQVSQGQTRIAVIWKRLIFPDTTSINLGTFEGQDQGGFAGFHDEVDTHFWQKLGDALLLSIAGAAVQLSQPQNNSNNGYNSQQVAAAQLGQQFAQLGQAYAMAGLSIPNTLVIRPGYSFIIMAAKDVPLRPFVDHRDTVANFGPVMAR